MLTAVHAQPRARRHPTLPVDAGADRLRSRTEHRRCTRAPNENGFDTALAVEPLDRRRDAGLVGHTRVGRCRAAESDAMIPALGVGLPRSIVSNATDDPTDRTREYR